MADVRITGHRDPARNRLTVTFTVDAAAIDENLNDLLGRVEAATKEFAQEHEVTVQKAER